VAVVPISADALLARVDEFFMNIGPVHKTMRGLVRRLSEQRIDYALVGGMALVLHGYRRETIDVDVLLGKQDHQVFLDSLVGCGYVPLFPGAKKSFRDVETGVEIDILTEGEYPGDGKPKPVSFPNPASASVDVDGIRVVALHRLIELKLASGMTAPDRLRDLADVQELIKLKMLDSGFAEQLHPYVREKFLELWSALARGGDDEQPDGPNEPAR
jgi:hypothetical protein